MASTIVDVADAVVALLNAGVAAGNVFGERFTAVRDYVPEIDLGELNGIAVFVVPREIVATNLTRAHDQEDVSIDVGVFKNLLTARREEVDALFLLIQQMSGVLRKRLTTVPASWVGRRSEPIYDAESLVQRRVFRSVTTYTYRVLHDIRL